MKAAIVKVSESMVSDWLEQLGIKDVCIIGMQLDFTHPGVLLVKLEGEGLPEKCRINPGNVCLTIDVEVKQETGKMIAKFV